MCVCVCVFIFSYKTTALDPTRSATIESNINAAAALLVRMGDPTDTRTKHELTATSLIAHDSGGTEFVLILVVREWTVAIRKHVRRWCFGFGSDVFGVCVPRIKMFSNTVTRSSITVIVRQLVNVQQIQV